MGEHENRHGRLTLLLGLLLAVTLWVGHLLSRVEESAAYTDPALSARVAAELQATTAPLTATPTRTGGPSATPTRTGTPRPTATRIPNALFLPLLVRAVGGTRPFSLLWSDNRSGNWDIWVSSGNAVRSLTADWTTSDEIDPAWSWDGQAIAFASNREGNHFEIWRMDANGGNRRRLTQTVAGSVNVQPAWSPDGKMIVFTSDAGIYYGNLDIYAVPADATEPIVITDVQHRWTWPPPPPVPTATPVPPTATVTPTSTPPIAATATPQPTVTYYDNYRRIASSRQPSFSPDGRQVVFTSNRDGHDEIYLMDFGGHNCCQRLTYGRASNIWPKWSYNGDQIAFASKRDGNWEIYSMRPDGTGEMRLTDHLAADSQPSWSPLGTRLVFVTNRNGRNDLYEVAADGSGIRAVLVDGFQHYGPAWSP